jgi:hypothetical protein
MQTEQLLQEVWGGQVSLCRGEGMGWSWKTPLLPPPTRPDSSSYGLQCSVCTLSLVHVLLSHNWSLPQFPTVPK